MALQFAFIELFNNPVENAVLKPAEIVASIRLKLKKKAKNVPVHGLCIHSLPHSLLNTSAGFTRAERSEWKLIVSSAIIRASRPPSRKASGLTAMR